MGAIERLRSDAVNAEHQTQADVATGLGRARRSMSDIDQNVHAAEDESLARYEARRDQLAADIEPPATDDSPEPR